MPINVLMPALSPTMTEGNAGQVARQGGRQRDLRRRDRRDRDRQGDHGGRSSRRRHARQDPGARGHRGGCRSMCRSRLCWKRAKMLRHSMPRRRRPPLQPPAAAPPEAPAPAPASRSGACTRPSGLRCAIAGAVRQSDLRQRPWPGAWPSRPDWTWPRSRAAALMAVSSRPMSRRRWPAACRLPPQRPSAAAGAGCCTSGGRALGPGHGGPLGHVLPPRAATPTCARPSPGA